ncbi:IPT/TIG domain-containing protein [Anthocerotibacter panamensis]|uniref:IPT/TIG domain-containing protein n=1 Tax=Anthocerotibacter panamensis TaxID=2857077 RepID=UPI0036F28761
MWLQLFLLSVLTVFLGLFPVEAAPFTLTLTNGSQSGTYESGATVNVWADPAAPGWVFDHWTGNITGLTDVNAAHSTLVMPAANTAITAVYKNVNPWLAPRVIASFPPVAATSRNGVIFLFHGSGGRASTLFRDVEIGILVKEAAARNFGVVALDSEDAITRTWDVTNPAATNLDMQNVVQVRNYFIAQGLMNLSDPVFLLGVSQGGQFISLLSQAAPSLGFSVKAQALYISSGDNATLGITTVPSYWALAQFDGLSDGTSPNDRAVSNFTSLVNRSVAGQLRVNIPAPLYPFRFWRIPGLTNVDSQNIFTALKNGGYLDANNYLRDDPLTSTWSSVIPSVYTPYLSDIGTQLTVSFAEHDFFSDFDNRVLDFFTTPTTVISIVPTIASFSPASAAVGDTVTITGTNYAGITAISFGGVTAPSFTVNSDTRITVTVPVGALNGPLRATNAAGTGISSTSFLVAGIPQISDFSPASGAVGSTIVITGSSLNGATSVSFDGVATSFIVNSPTQISAIVPDGASNGAIRVATPGGTAISSTTFVVVLGPAITGFSPSSALVGDTVTLTGTGFLGTTTVRFGGVTAPTFTVNSDTRITVSVPVGALSGPISITNAAGTATSSANFLVAVPPAITGFSPASGIVGSPVTITGTDFTGVFAVSFGGVPVSSFTVDSSTQIRTTVPVGATSGSIRVSTPGGTAVSSASFGVVLLPSITSFTPTLGGTDTLVTISGTNFGAVTGVSFGGVTAPFTINSATTIRSTVPAGAASGPISVTNPAGTALSPTSFTIVPVPTLTALSPNRGPVGTAVVITGTNLTAASTVTFGGIAATSFTVNSPTQITAIVPATAATGQVRVTTAGGTTSGLRFTVTL